MTNVFIILVGCKKPIISDVNNLDRLMQKFEYEAKFGCNFVSQPPFKLTDAYNELRRLDGFSSMYLPGVYYDGTLSQIMNGATVQEWKSITKILKNQKEIERSHKIDWRGSNALDIDQNNEIRFLRNWLNYFFSHKKYPLVMKKNQPWAKQNEPQIYG